MNRMMGVGEDLTSSISPFRRFSNSPLTPAPAWSSARSSPRTFCRLPDPRLPHQDRVVLAAPGQDVHHLADLGVTAQDRVELPLLGPLREIVRVLVQVGRRPGGSRLARSSRGRGNRAYRVLHGARHDVVELLSEVLAHNLHELTAELPHHPPELVVQCQRE